MKRKVMCIICAFMMVSSLVACSSTKKETVKIGASFGVGAATRWEQEAEFMKKKAKKLDAKLEVRINRNDEPKTQEEDCIEMIDSGIDVLILIPRDVNNVEKIIAYAKKKEVKVVSYARAVLGDEVDLYVGYDSYKIGQMMGEYLSELVYQGDYIILKGDDNDYNAKLLSDGAMESINEIKDKINIILNTSIAGWDPTIAKEKVKEAVVNNGNKVDAILAPNDKIAGACREALDELGITTPVVITGMDSELEAIQRIAKDKQSMSVYMDLKELADTAINESVRMANGEKPKANAKFDNGGKKEVDASLIVGTIITSKNIQKNIIDKGIYTKEEIYGE